MAIAEAEQRDGKERTSGVQELIDRIRSEGVAQGRGEAETLVAAAREEAVRILDEAKREAEQIRSTARVEADRLRSQTEEALRLAARDAVLALQEALRADFVSKVRRLVSHTMQDRSFLQRLILEIAHRSVPQDESPMTVLLPANLMTYEELKQNPQDLSENSLSRFVLELASEVLREGLTFIPADDQQPGIRVQLQGEDVEIDLTDEAVSNLLIEYLAPRFRALMERPQV
ncbi:hypothetical protein [Candidatus Laterigemmans baculatus]|uniref:hypothetical protein n=1 Tax=Candidatus Laterigemmans baculatus TaxID=2770505 RepID=UPI0013DB764A|nr:hypothetical protein [Candidatus Laterigemmans baculatus]